MTDASRTSEDDVLTLLVVGVGSLGVVGGVLAATWSRALTWLLEHQVVVAASRHPLLVLPRSAGAGVDLPRAALALAAVLLIAVAVVGAMRRRLRIWAAVRELR